MRNQNLCLTEKDLIDRIKNIPSRLQILTGPEWIQAKSRPIQDHLKAIGVNQGKTSGYYRDWRVATNKTDIKVSYYEIWNYKNRKCLEDIFGKRDPRSKEGGLYFLIKAYLHLYRVSSPGREEDNFIFLHCDPQESGDSTSNKYKIIPHLHIGGTSDPWKNAHIALCHGWQNEVLKSINDLDQAISNAIELIAEELFPLADNIL